MEKRLTWDLKTLAISLGDYSQDVMSAKNYSLTLEPSTPVTMAKISLINYPPALRLGALSTSLHGLSLYLLIAPLVVIYRQRALPLLRTMAVKRFSFRFTKDSSQQLSTSQTLVAQNPVHESTDTPIARLLARS